MEFFDWAFLVLIAWAFIFWIFFCCLIGGLAKKDGRNFWIWFCMSMVISPLLSGMILLIAHLVKD